MKGGAKEFNGLFVNNKRTAGITIRKDFLSTIKKFFFKN